MPNPNLVNTTVRTVGGLASNYSVLLFPVALLAFRQNIAILQNDLGPRFAIDDRSETICRSIARDAALAHVLVLTIPALLALIVPVEAQMTLAVRVILCAAAAAICWRLLSRIDMLMARAR